MRRTAYLTGLTGGILLPLLPVSFCFASLFFHYSAGTGMFGPSCYLAASLCALCMAVKARESTRRTQGIRITVLGLFLAYPPVDMLVGAAEAGFAAQGETVLLGGFGTAAVLLYAVGGIFTLITCKKPYPSLKPEMNHTGRFNEILGYAAGGTNLVLGVFAAIAAASSFRQDTYYIMKMAFFDEPDKPMLLALILLLQLLTLAGALLRRRDRPAGAVLQLTAGAVLLFLLLITAAGIVMLHTGVPGADLKEVPAGYLGTPLTAALLVCQLAVIASGILTARGDKTAGI